MLFQSPQIAQGHGFGANTLIELANDSQKTIHAICRHVLRNPISVSSCDIDSLRILNQPIKMGKKSETNCYIQFSFDDQFDATGDIICTPTQEFYVSASDKWVPAYQLQQGDELLAKNGITKSVRHKEFVPEPVTIYMIEIESSHTFFVGKHSLLTHNMFLPVAINLGFVVPFGTVATGAAGSFFGPIGLVGGAIIGGIIGVTLKAWYKKRIPAYDSPIFDIAFFQNSCHNISNVESNFVPSGCFTAQEPIDTSCKYPIENPLPQIPTGCIEIEMPTSDAHVINECSKNHDQEKAGASGCFQPADQNPQTIGSNNDKPRYDDHKARNWKEFEKNCPIGQKYGKKFVHTGLQNPKDGSPIRRLSEDIPNTEMFKKDRLFAPDRYHAGDHFEVWDKRGNWIGAANLDGSMNHEKTNAVKNRDIRNIKDIL